MLLDKPSHTSAADARGRKTHAPSVAATEAGYEVKDLSAKGLGFILAALGLGAALLVGTVFGMGWLFAGWDRQQTIGLTSEQTAPIETPGPHLQTDPAADLRSEQARERHVRDRYAWLDASHTSAHIPIDRAMKLVTGRSLDDTP